MAQLWISDTHLGHPSNNLEKIFRVLERKPWTTIHLVGDIIDLDALNRHSTLSKHDMRFIAWIAAYARKGGKIRWAAGNHDKGIKPLLAYIFPGVRIDFADEFAEGSTLTLHGDIFDQPTKLFKVPTRWRKRANVRRVTKYAKKNGFRTVIMGHTHNPEEKVIDNVRYLNCGDWMGSSTWIEENQGYIDIFCFRKEQIGLLCI